MKDAYTHLHYTIVFNWLNYLIQEQIPFIILIDNYAESYNFPKEVKDRKNTIPLQIKGWSLENTFVDRLTLSTSIAFTNDGHMDFAFDLKDINIIEFDTCQQYKKVKKVHALTEDDFIDEKEKKKLSSFEAKNTTGIKRSKSILRLMKLDEE